MNFPNHKYDYFIVLFIKSRMKVNFFNLTCNAIHNILLVNAYHASICYRNDSLKKITSLYAVDCDIDPSLLLEAGCFTSSITYRKPSPLE
jgi:hypothetical protein